MSDQQPPGIDMVQLVMIPTTDQARSVAFYQSLGFEVRADFPWSGYPWSEVYSTPTAVFRTELALAG